MSGTTGNFGRAVFALGVNRQQFEQDIQGAQRDAAQGAAAIDKPLASVGASFAAALGERADTMARILSDSEKRAQASADRIASFVSKIEAEGPSRAFQSSLTAAETGAAQASGIINRNLQGAGSTLGDGVRAGVRVVDEQLGQAERRSREASSRISSEFGKFKDTLGQGLTLGGGIGIAQAGIETFRKGVDFVTDSVVNYNASLQTTEGQLRVLGGTQQRAAELVALARKEADAGRGSFIDLSGAIATLAPAARTLNLPMDELIKLVERLAALNPEQGIAGAAYAIREASAGQYQSIADRFNISRQALQSFRDQGFDSITSVSKALDQMGVTFDLVEQHSRNLQSVETRLEGVAKGVIAGAGKPVFDELIAGLDSVARKLNDPAIQRGAQAFGRQLGDAIRDINRAASNPETAAFLGDVARGFVAISAVRFKETTDQLVGLLEVVTALARPLSTATDLIGALASAANKLPGGEAVGNFLRTFENFNVLSFAAQNVKILTDQLDKLNAQIERKQNLENQPGQNTGPGSFPLAGPNPSAGINPGNASGPQVGSQAAPGGQRAIEPPTEQQFNITAQANDRLAAALAAQDKIVREAAIRSALGYVASFTSEYQKDFQDASDILHNTLLAAVGGDETKINAQQQAQAYRLIAQAIGEIQTTGKPGADTLAVIKQLLGDSSGPILQYVAGLQQLKAAQEAATEATERLKAAQAGLAQVQANAARNISAAQADVARAQQEANDHAAEANARLKEQQDIINGISHEAEEAARHYQDIARGLQSQYDAAQRAAQAAQEQRRAIIEQAQTAVETDRKIGAEHAAAFAAIESGTVAQFLAMNGEIDASTQKIIDSYNQQASAAIAARNAASDKADNIGAEGRAKALALETQIRAARGRGDIEGAAALERQLRLEQQRYSSREQFARLQAQVADDQVRQALKPVQSAAEAQAAADAAKQRADQKKLEDAQAQDKAATASEQARLQAIRDQIDANQRLADDEARRFADAQRAAQARLTEIQNAADQQKIADDANIKRQQAIATVITNAWNAATAGAQLVVGNATIAEQKAKDELTHREKMLDNLKEQIKALDDFYTKYPGLVPVAPGSPPPPTRQSPVPGNVDDPATRSSADPGSAGAAAAGNVNPPPDDAPGFGGAGPLNRVPLDGGDQFLRASLGGEPAAPPPRISRPVAMLDSDGRIMPLRRPVTAIDVRNDGAGISLPRGLDRLSDGATAALSAGGGGGGVTQQFNAPLVSYPNLTVSSREDADYLIARSHGELRRMLSNFASAGRPTF